MVRSSSEDEKWFYPWSRQKALKFLPKATFEEDGVERTKVKKVICRRHPVKMMFMAAITSLCEEQNFDGKISLIRLSHQDNEINQLLLDSDWRKLYEDIYNVAELLVLISDYYEL
jgi:hypothetical protein